MKLSFTSDLYIIHSYRVPTHQEVTRSLIFTQKAIHT